MVRSATRSAPRAAVTDDTLRSHFGYRLKRCFNVFQADLARTLAPLDLRMLTYTALMLVEENPGLRQSELARAMDMERPNLVSILDELEGRGLLTRDRVPTDRRAYAVNLTDAGRALCRAANAAVLEHEARLTGDLAMELRRAAEAAMAAIEAGGGAGKP